jgi:acetoin utilization deacetylase AcuC-like enzyme
MAEVVTPVIRQYEPQFILVSAGFDGHYSDPVGKLSLSALCYQEVYETIMNLAAETCGGRLVAVLEGGYSLRFVGGIAATAIAIMGRVPRVLNDNVPAASERVKRQGETVLREVKKVQKAFWNIN